MDVPILTPPKPADTVGPQIRLLVCRQCKTIDELPDYEGDPAHDDLLQVSIERNHTDRLTGTTHLGHLAKVPVSQWARADVRAEIIKQFKTGSPGLSALDEDFYDTRSTFFEDAMACFKQHLRPKGRCPDWKADNKRLIPNTAAERKEAGLDKPGRSGASGTYLCQFCPVSAYMLTKGREEAGLYD